MIYTFNPSTWVAKAGEWQVEGRLAWATFSNRKGGKRGSQGTDFKIDTAFSLTIKNKRNKRHRFPHSEEH